MKANLKRRREAHGFHYYINEMKTSMSCKTHKRGTYIILIQCYITVQKLYSPFQSVESKQTWVMLPPKKRYCIVKGCPSEINISYHLFPTKIYSLPCTIPGADVSQLVEERGPGLVHAPQLPRHTGQHSTLVGRFQISSSLYSFLIQGINFLFLCKK